MQNFQQKYAHLTFRSEIQKKQFFEKLENIYETLSSSEEKTEFLSLCEGNLNYFRQFDAQVLYNPLAFFDAFLENDFL